MEALVTYIPFYRIHEVFDYFLANAQIIKPKRKIVYVDNVYTDRQVILLRRILPEDVELKWGNWRSRGGTWFAILKDHHEIGGEILVVDSDNILSDSYMEVHNCLSKYPIYTILNFESYSPDSLFIKLSRLVEAQCKAYLYRVYRGSLGALLGRGPPFFIGPKQAVYIKTPIDKNVVEKVERAFSQVNPALRQHISDETVLGVIAYYSELREVPWAVASNHYHHGSIPPKVVKSQIALAHYQFAKALRREFNTREVFLYEIKYLAAYYKNAPAMR